ncbi:MAG: VCBS repeat-containing protein [Bryobacterales bacterium]
MSRSCRDFPAAFFLLVLAAAGASIGQSQPNEIPFTRVTVDREPPAKPYYKMAGDIDGDGNPDIVVAGDGKSLVWYSYPSWQRTEIAEQGWSGVNGELADMDGDGDLDIVMGSVVWFRNPRDGRLLPPGGRTWERIEVDDQAAHDIEVGDLDLDGRLDIVVRNQSAFRRSQTDPGGSEIYLYFQTERNAWSKQKIDSPHGEGLDLADLDQDGDLDILIGARWYENTRRGVAASWPERVYTSQWAEPDAKVEATDMNGDGSPDIVLTPSELGGETYKIAWYEHPSAGTAGEWAEHVVVASIECVIHALGVGDIDGDSDADIVIAEMHQGEDPDEVSVLVNEKSGAGWRKQVISTNGSHDIVLADIDGDSDLDIFGANHAGVAPLELWRNERNSKEGAR